MQTLEDIVKNSVHVYVWNSVKGYLWNSVGRAARDCVSYFSRYFVWNSIKNSVEQKSEEVVNGIS